MAMDIQTLLRATVEAGASDLHMSAGMPPLIRVRGEMVRSPAPALSDADARIMLQTLMSDEQRKEFQTKRDIDFAFELPGLCRFRANIFEQRRGIGGVFRVIATKIRPWKSGHAPRPQGPLDEGSQDVLVTVPTGAARHTLAP